MLFSKNWQTVFDLNNSKKISVEYLFICFVFIKSKNAFTHVAGFKNLSKNLVDLTRYKYSRKLLLFNKINKNINLICKPIIILWGIWKMLIVERTITFNIPWILLSAPTILLSVSPATHIWAISCGLSLLHPVLPNCSNLHHVPITRTIIYISQRCPRQTLQSCRRYCSTLYHASSWRTLSYVINAMMLSCHQANMSLLWTPGSLHRWSCACHILLQNTPSY